MIKQYQREMSILITSTYRALSDLTSAAYREVKKRPKTTFAAVLGLAAFGYAYQNPSSFSFDLSSINLFGGASENNEINVPAILSENKRCTGLKMKEDPRCKEDPNAPAALGDKGRYEDLDLPIFSSLKLAIDKGSIELLQKANKEGLFSKVDSLTLDLITEYTAYAGAPNTLKEVVRMHPKPTKIHLPSLLQHGQSHLNQTLTETGLFNTFEKEISDPSVYLLGFFPYSDPFSAMNRAALLTSLVPHKPDYVERFLDKCAYFKTSITTQLYKVDALALLRASMEHEHVELTEKIISNFQDLSTAELFTLIKNLDEANLTKNQELAYLKLVKSRAFNQFTLLDIAKLPITAQRSSQVGDALRARYSELMETQKTSLTEEDFKELISHLGEGHTLAIITQPEEKPHEDSEEDLPETPFYNRAS